MSVSLVSSHPSCPSTRWPLGGSRASACCSHAKVAKAVVWVAVFSVLFWPCTSAQVWWVCRNSSKQWVSVQLWVQSPTWAGLLGSSSFAHTVGSPAQGVLHLHVLRKERQSAYTAGDLFLNLDLYQSEASERNLVSNSNFVLLLKGDYRKNLCKKYVVFPSFSLLTCVTRSFKVEVWFFKKFHIDMWALGRAL